MFSALNELKCARDRRPQGRPRSLFQTGAHDDRLVSAGACFAYVRHPFGDETASAVAKRLADEQNILALPGSTFGPDQESCLRFAYANLSVEMIQALGTRLGG